MPQLSWLQAEQVPDFPDTKLALTDPDGLLAAGGQLTVEWLLCAYSKGIFPWYCDGEPILWWSPAPRMVLRPGTAHISRSLKKHFRTQSLEIKVNQCFADVINQCSKPRSDSDSTWIIEEMRNAYLDLHKAGWAHSIEVYHRNELIGGLYGVAIESVFYGESMFSLNTNASKYAFIALSEWAKDNGISMIDCQLYNPYLASLGATLIDRQTFEQQLPASRIKLNFGESGNITDYLNRAFIKS